VDKTTSKRFQSHLDKFIKIDEHEFVAISAFFQTVKVKKKENLLHEGQACK
jgi:hypothetical protein